MPKTPYLSAPIKSTGMPAGIPYIIGNEGAERFSFYGMRAILVVFMTQGLVNAAGQPDTMTQDQAKAWFHLFTAAIYFLPLFGAILADAWLGKYRTIISLSLVYCLGNLALALDSTRLGLALGLTLIALGSGGIKPCVSANVGDQFGASNQHLLARVFGWFYFSINFGTSISTLLIPWLLEKWGPHVAFGTPGVFMLLATWIFWLGRHKYVHVPPAGTVFLRELCGREGLRTVFKLVGLFVFVSVFYALYDQSASAWVLQAKKLDCRWLGYNWLPAQIQAVNPILILVFIPLFSYWIYPAIHRFFPLTALRKMSMGLFMTVIAFLIPTWIETQIALGLHPSVAWQLLAYVALTMAEVMVSITCLEFSYTQAPKRMKSLVMAIYLMSIALGNAFTAAVNFFIQNPDGSSKLAGASYYGFFTGLMLVTALLFIGVAWCYRGENHLQEEQEIG